VIRPGRGSLLDAQTDALVNPVNCAGVMGKGLALQFRRKWPAMYTEYAQVCRDRKLEPGSVHIWATGGLNRPTPQGSDLPFYVLNFPTKWHWSDDSRIEHIEKGLDALIRVIAAVHLTSVAIPALGCGCGRLDWREVRPLIETKLGSLPLDVVLWEPR
jgi:O-acetyl-ADP-ribose deacetylase (regulator of RNase III)